jgi:hypothetical protein
MTKVKDNFIHLGGRYGELDKRTLKFTYKKPISEIESEYHDDRQSFFSSIIKNKGYKIDDLKSVYAKKGFIKRNYAS